MRVLAVMVALLFAPFVAGISQDRPKPPKPDKCEREARAAKDHKAFDEHHKRHDPKHARRHHGKHECATTPGDDGSGDGGSDDTGGTGGTGGGGDPGGTTACVNSTPADGTESMFGQVYLDSGDEPGLANWCIHVTGPVSATAVTDAEGYFLFTNLPVGVYTVCEDIPTGWTQTSPTSGPTCPTGYGRTIDTAVEGLWFWFSNVGP